MELNNFVAKLCKGKSGYEFLPRKSISLDLPELAKKLRETGFEIKAETKLVLLAEKNTINISAFKDGKILVKDIADEAKAKDLASGIASCFENAKLKPLKRFKYA